MENAYVFPSSFQFSDYDPVVAGYARDEAASRSRISTSTKEDPFLEMDESGFMDLFSSLFGQENTQLDLERKADDQLMMIGGVPQTVSASGCSMLKQIETETNLIEARKHEDIQPPAAVSEFSRHLKNSPVSVSPPPVSWDLLNNCGKGFRMSRDENLNGLENESESDVGGRRLSMDEILRLGGERFIQFSTKSVDGISMFIHPYASSLSGLSMDDTRDVELVNLLLAAAENVTTRRFDLATKFVARCLWMASDSGTPVQRVAFYFAEALQEKINRESGRIVNEKKNQAGKQKKLGLALGTNNTFLASHQELPFIQVMQFAGMQTIVEHVKTAGKIHLIDLQIRSGIQWTALMQGLADSPIQHLKITAVGTRDQPYVEETGNRLLCFAQSLNLPFTFKSVYLTDMKAFKEDLLNIEADETVVVYSNVILRSMISKPDCLENLMRTITRLKPSLMVVTEVEANHNSPSFVDRFMEAFLFYSAFFDCIEDCMDRNNQHRTILESTYLSEGILNIVADDGQERFTRSVKLDVWRAFFMRFGMIEIELSESSRYQASLTLKQFAHGNSCTLESNGKGLTVGWKGTPINSLTAWKFS
ncbi:UNVERIFIED_CONTAM: Scarecrow-like protein 11 [Sesamum radiatum]|uniref:Scarecrow-like protein 11 n=1 Tax=Sesamum radiatum TaxID=300843 RepID=A0AAW2USB9_SESRA